MPGPVERHVLQEMREPVLVVLFLQSSHIVYDVEIRTPFRIGIVADIIGHSVVEPACDQLRVVWDSFLRKGCHRYDCGSR